MKKTHILGIVMIVLFVIGCTAAAFINFIVSLGIIPLVCNQMFPDQPSRIEFCDSIVSILLQTAAGTIEIHNADTGRWVVLTRIPEQFDLMELQEKQKSMVYKEILPGKYDKLRIDVEKVEIITSNKKYDAIMPNNELILDINMIVEKNKKSVVELKMDLADSLHLTEDGGVVFTPVIDIKSKKNAQIQIIDKTKKLIKTLSSTIVESKKVGMDFDGKMKKDFSVDKNLRLSLQNNGKVIIKESRTPVAQSPVKAPIITSTPVISSSPPIQESIKTNGSTQNQQSSTGGMNPPIFPSS